MTTTLPFKPVFGALALILALAAPWLLSAYDLNLLARFLALALTAMGLVLLWGEGGVLSLGQGVFFGLGGYAIAMHLKLADLGPSELPDFMVWSGVTALPWWWAVFRSPVAAVLAILLVAPAIAALFAWLIFRRRIGGVYFALLAAGPAPRLPEAALSPRGESRGRRIGGGQRAGLDRRLQRPDRLPPAVRLQPQPPRHRDGAVLRHAAVRRGGVLRAAVAARQPLRKAAARQPRRSQPTALPGL